MPRLTLSEQYPPVCVCVCIGPWHCVQFGSIWFGFDKDTSADRQGHPRFRAFIGQGGSSDSLAEPSSRQILSSFRIPNGAWKRCEDVRFYMEWLWAIVAHGFSIQILFGQVGRSLNMAWLPKSTMITMAVWLRQGAPRSIRRGAGPTDGSSRGSWGRCRPLWPRGMSEGKNSRLVLPKGAFWPLWH